MLVTLVCRCLVGIGLFLGVNYYTHSGGYVCTYTYVQYVVCKQHSVCMLDVFVGSHHANTEAPLRDAVEHLKRSNTHMCIHYTLHSRYTPCVCACVN